MLNLFLTHFVDLLLFLFFSDRVGGVNCALTSTVRDKRLHKRLVVVLVSGHDRLRLHTAELL